MQNQKILKTFLMALLATLVMANKECEKEPEPRVLKKNVKILSMEASSFMDSSAFNFAEQAQNSLPSQQWKSRVVISSDNYIGILGGDELGIKVGDQFVIENENHSWLGEPCGPESILIASIATTIKPWIVEVDRIGTGLSRAKVLNENENESIRIGAAVKIYKLYVEPQLAK